MLKTNCLKLAKNIIIFSGIILSFVFFFNANRVFALSTDQINLQGKIVRNDTGYEGLNVTAGNPTCVVDGVGNDTCDFRVRYYSAASGGTLFLTEVFSNKEIGQYNGAFNLSLGSDSSPTAGTYSSLDALIEGENTVYVEIGFDPAGGGSYTETFTRMPLQATAYAIRSKYSSHASTAFQFDTATSSSGYTSPSAGMVYFDTTDTVLKVYDGASWTDIGSGTGSSLWTDDGLFSYLTDLTDHFVLGSDSYTAIGTSDYATYTAGLASQPPLAYDMGAGRLTLSGSTARSGLAVYSDYNSTGAWPLVLFKAEDSGFDNVVLEVVQDGTGHLMSLKKGSTEVFAFENEMTFFMRPRDTAPGTSANRLYNVGGTLYWNGNALATGGSSLWTDSGTYTYLTDSDDDLIVGGNSSATAAFYFDVANGRFGIGTGSPTSRLDIAGASSIISNSSGDITITPEESVVIKAQNTNGDNLMEWQNSSGTILMSAGGPSSILSLAANSATRSQLNFASSTGIDVSSPNTGDVWYNGTNLYFYDGTDHIDLLVGNADGVGIFSEYGLVSNGGYLNVQHNEDTYNILADGWICVGGGDNATCSGGNWKNIKEESVSIRHALKEDWDDAGAGGIIRTEIRDTSVSLSPAFNPGTGTDGDVVVQYNTSINATNLISGRVCADGGDAVNYSITAFTSSTTATLSSAPSVGCLVAGDEVLIINLQGTYTAMDNVGNYETLEVSDVSSTTVTFKTAKKNYYGDGLTNDTNLGVTTSTQRVMLQRVPNYRNLTVSSGANFYPTAWNGVKGGVIFFRASVSANINGTLHADLLGFNGGVSLSNVQGGGGGGEAFCGLGGASVASGAGNNGAGGGAGARGTNGLAGDGYCGGGGGGGVGLGSSSTGGAGGGGQGYRASGGGAGYGTPGAGGGADTYPGINGGSNSSGNGGAFIDTGGGGGGGGTHGDEELAKLFLGGGGGSGGPEGASTGGTGGTGGGIIYLSAGVVTVSGSVSSNAGNGGSKSGTHGGGGGGGAGGSMRIDARNVNIGSSKITVTGGTGGSGSTTVGGVGGDGRIAVYYADSYSGTSANPSVTNYYQEGYNSYGIYNSPVVATPNAQTYDNVRWSQDLDTYGNISLQTRSGNSTNPLDGTWEEWKPFESTDNYAMLESADTHTNWSGTNTTVAEGDVARGIDYFEDEDESTVTNVTKITSSTSGGYAEATITSTDLSSYDYITGWVRASQIGNTLRLGFGESAATEQYEDITIDASDTWQKVYWDISDIAGASKDGVTKLRLTNQTSSSNTIYIDNVRAEKLTTDNDSSEITSTPNNYLQYRIIFSTTDLAYQPVLENITMSYNSGYQIVIYDNNNVRLYNHTGSSKYLKLDLATSGGAGGGSGTGFVAGVAMSTVANGEDAVAFSFNTSEAYSNPSSKLLSVMNNSTEKMYLDADGNLFVSGSIISGSGFGSGLVNNSGGTVAKKSLVTIDPTANNSFTTTSLANMAGAFGVVTGVNVNNDTDKDGNCDDGDTCIVVFDGVTDVLMTNAASTLVGHYIYSSATGGSAKSSSEQENGLIGVVTSVADSGSGYVKMVFDSQNKVTADLYLNVGFDKNAYRDMYTLLAKDYEIMGLAERRGVIESNQSESVMFDTFVDGLKMDSEDSTMGVDTDSKKAGLWGGVTIDGSMLDSAGNRYLGSATATLLTSKYYDRTQSGLQGQDSTPETLVDLGIDPNWYNGVSLQTATNITTSYNGSLINVSGTYGSGSEHGTISLTITGTTATGITANIASSDGACSVTGATIPFNSNYSFVAGSCSGGNITIKVLRGEYNSGDVFRISSWFVEPATADDRGNRREFPERSVILASSDASNGYLSIIDIDSQRVWMKFVQSSTGEMLGVALNNTISSISMNNGTLNVGMNGSAATGMYSVQFSDSLAYKYNTSGKSISNKSISDRNIANTYSVVNASQALVNNVVNDVSSATIPNQPTQNMTVSGWGWILGSATPAISESVNLPYKFDDIPRIQVVANSSSSSAPASIKDCGSMTGNTTQTLLVTNSNFNVQLYNYNGSNLGALYYCYTWTATGTVSPKQFVAVATGSASADGGTSILNKTNGTIANIILGSQNGSVIWTSKVALTTKGAVYSAYNEPSLSQLVVYYNGATITSDASWIEKINGYYRVASASYWGGALTGPVIAGPSATTNAITSLAVKERTSTIDGSSNTLYVGTSSGLSVIQEQQSYVGDYPFKGGMENAGSVKYYTKDYISEQMVGDVRGMWPLNGAITDASIKANTLTNNGSVTFASGVRGQAAVFNGSNYLSCTDASCGGTTKLDIGSSAWSVGAWIKTTTNGTQQILSKGASGQYSYQLYTYGTPGKAYFDLINTGSGAYSSVSGNSTLTDGNWHYVVGIWNPSGTITSIYVDGNLENSVTTTSGTLAADTTADFNIGRRADNSQFFTGSIDEPFVTATALTASQIKSQYEDGLRALKGSHSVDDTYNQLSGTSNDVRDILVTPDSKYMYVGTEGGGISKMDLTSSTRLNIYNTATDPATSTNNIETISGRYYPVFAGDIGSSGRIMGIDSNGNNTTATYLSNQISFVNNSNKAYLWMNAYIDPDDVSGAITVSVSNDGGSNYEEGNLIRATGTTLKEYEYSFDFNTPDNEYIVKIELERGSSKKSTVYVNSWGLAQMDISTASGNGIYTESADVVADKGYIEVVHGQNTYNILATGWVYNTSLAKWVKTSDSNVTVSHNKNSDWLKDPSLEPEIPLWVDPITGNPGTLNSGTGNDGSCIINNGTKILDSTAGTSVCNSSARTPAYAVNFSVTTNVAAGSNAVTVSATPTGLTAGDEILIINLQGSNSDFNNVGQYDTAYIDSIATNTLNLDRNLTYGYDGVTQKIMVQRIPNFVDVTVCGGNTGGGCTAAATVTASAWNGTKGGVIFFRSTGTISINTSGIITGSGLGYLGGTQTGGYNYGGGQGGEAVCGVGGNGSTTTVAGNGAAGGGSYTGSSGSGYCGGAGGGNSEGLGSPISGGSGGGGGRRAGGGGAGYGTPGTAGFYDVAGNIYQGVNGGTNSSGKGGGGSWTSYIGGGGGGGTYGEEGLNKLIFGSGGGRGGNEASPQLGGAGGNGGGIINIVGSTISVGSTGGLANNGLVGGAGASGTSYYTGGGGGGAGGSIRIEAGTLNIGASFVTVTGGGGGTGRVNNAATVNGGTGGDGRIAIYFTTSYIGISGSPTVTSFYTVGEEVVQNPSAGTDGSITVSSNTNINRTSLIVGRSCADGGDAVNYNITAFSVAGNEATLNRAPSTGCLASGDEVLIINLQGSYTAMDNVGNWEVLVIDELVGTTITFTTVKTKYYGNNLDDDTNLGTTANTQRVMLQRVPQYEDVTVNSSINFYPDKWAEETSENATYRVGKGGVMFFKASGDVNINGTIHANGMGYRGPIYDTALHNGGYGGEAFCGLGGAGVTDGIVGSNGAAGGGSRTAFGGGNGYCGGGGGGGGTSTTSLGSPNRGGSGGGGGGHGAGGGGGGYGTAGTGGGGSSSDKGENGGTNSSGDGFAPNSTYAGGGGGGAYGDGELNKLNFGSSGGEGSEHNAGASGYGGNGGGIVYISAGSITVSGNLQSNGVNGTNASAGTTYSGGGGGGAGGAVMIEGETVNIGSSKLTVTGGSGGTGYYSPQSTGGAGGSGRVAVYYTDTYSGTSGTPAVTNFYELDPSTMGDVEVEVPTGIIRTMIGLTDISLESGVDTGDGRDGNVTVTYNTNINRTSLIAGRSCADGGDAVNYNIVAFNSGGTEATLNRAPSLGCLEPGDEVLIINVQGTYASMDNVGNYETLRIQSITNTTVRFTASKTKYYGNNLNDDTNLGTTANSQRVMLQRVPNYENLTINASVNFYPDAWGTETSEDSVYRVSKGGVMFFRATGDVNVNGTLHADGKGYRGGDEWTNASAHRGGEGGEAYCGLGGLGSVDGYSGGPGASGGGGGDSGGGSGYCGGGGGADGAFAGGLGSANRGGSGGGGGGLGGGAGAGYGASGGGGWKYTNNVVSDSGGTNSSANGLSYWDYGGGGGGGTYGNPELTKLMMGSGGGKGGYYNNGTGQGGNGGNGAGVVSVFSNTITVSGYIRSVGNNGVAGTGATFQPGGGAGSGGSVLIAGTTVNMGSSKVLATGGTGATGTADGGTGGSGGAGRVAVYYSETYSGTSGSSAVTNFYEGGSYSYGMYHSNVIPTIGAGSFSDFRWNFDNSTYGQISIQTRTGSTIDSTDGSWEEWKPASTESASTSLENADNASSWVGTNITVSDGDTTRDIDFFEDEDEFTAGNITKMVSSTNGGYAEATITATDLSTYDFITMWVKASVINQSLSFSMGESAGDEHIENVVIDSLEWQKVYWDISDIASENRNAITKLRITNLTASTNTFYIDNVEAEVLPKSGLDSIYSTPDDYLQYRVIFTTTDTRFRPVFSSISFTYNVGYEIVQVDANKVRLYNYSGYNQKLRLDVVTGGLVFELSQGNNASVNIAPQVAQVDSGDYTSSIWINKTGTGGNLLQLQTVGTDTFVVNADGDTVMAGDIEIGGGSIKLGDSGWIRFNDSTNVLEFTNDGTDWIALGPLFTTMILPAEYPGAVFSPDGSNNTGNMTADNEGTSANSMNYYEWNSSEVSLNDYDVRVRFMLPSDFDSWALGGVTFNFATEATGTTNNKLDFYVYEESSATVDGSSETQSSSSAGVWKTTTVAGSTLDECSSAGDVCMFVIKMSSANDNYVRVGDIEIGYDRKL